MKAVLHYRAGPRLRDRLADLEEVGVRVVVVDETDVAGFQREIADADVLLHVLEPVTATMIAGAPKLRLIQKIGTGLNTIDRVAARTRGVRVANMPGTNSQAVAEHALALMLAVLRRLVLLDDATRRGRGWALPPEALEQVGELAGRTVAFVGFGAVPQRLAPVIRALGARTIHHSRTPAKDTDAPYRSFEALLAESDIVSLHIPSTPDTRGLIDGVAIERMKPGAVLINTARGDLVDEAALAAALRSGRLLGAGLDVFVEEPVAATSALLSLPNVVMTPHVAWLTPETIERSLVVAIENIGRLRADEPLLHEAPPP